MTMTLAANEMIHSCSSAFSINSLQSGRCVQTPRTEEDNCKKLDFPTLMAVLLQNFFFSYDESTRHTREEASPTIRSSNDLCKSAAN